MLRVSNTGPHLFAFAQDRTQKVPIPITVPKDVHVEHRITSRKRELKSSLIAFGFYGTNFLAGSMVYPLTFSDASPAFSLV
jgi:hypothetical protein